MLSSKTVLQLLHLFCLLWLALQEELVHLQQQLESGRQQRSKLEHERDQVLSEKQSYYKEAQRLQVTLQGNASSTNGTMLAHSYIGLAIVWWPHLGM
jgi:hypothetical protein